MSQLYLNGPVDDVINFLQIFLRTPEIDPGAWTVFRRRGLVLSDTRLPSRLELQHRDEIWTVSCCHKKVVESWSVDFRFSTPSVDFSCLSLIDNVFFICLGQGDANPGPLLLIYTIVQCLRPLGCWFPNLYLFYPFLSIVAVDAWIGSLRVDLLRTMTFRFLRPGVCKPGIFWFLFIFSLLRPLGYCASKDKIVFIYRLRPMS